MEAPKLIALLLCYCVAAVEPSLSSTSRVGTTVGTGSLLKPGYKIVTELPQPEPGFYLNRQFQKQRGNANGVPVQKKTSPTLAEHEPGFFLNRQFQKDDSASNKNVRSDLADARRQLVDASGRYWVVSETAQPEPGFYLNRQFQKDKVLKNNNLKKVVDNQVFLLRKNPNTNRKEVIQVKSTTERLSSVAASGETIKPTPTVQSNFYTTFQAHNGPQSIPAVRTQTQELQRPGLTQTVSAPATASSVPPSFIVRQMLSNRNTPQGGSADATTANNKERKSKNIAQAPSQQGVNSQGDGFSCEGKPFGYYSDLESNCQKYHICNPVTFSGGFTRHLKYSFNCSTGSRWDPEHKVCSPIGVASPCQ